MLECSDLRLTDSLIETTVGFKEFVLAFASDSQAAK